MQSGYFYLNSGNQRKRIRWANRIAKYRLQLGLTQTELANLIGVTKNTISKYERCEFQPSIINIVLLCRALDCDFSDLFSVYIF